MHIRLSYILFSTLLLLISLQEVKAQSFPDFKFRYLTMKDGLSNDYVTSIEQDQNGFVWLGTANGLNRYDGNRFKQFFHDPKNSNSLLHNYIWKLTVDHKNRVWICSSGGVSCYDQYSDSFINYQYSTKDKNSLHESNVKSLILSEDNKIWLSTSKGYYTIDDKMVLHKQPAAIWRNGVVSDTLRLVHPIYKDKAGRLWTHADSTLFELDNKTMQPIKRYTLPVKELSVIFQDKANRYWITTWTGKVYIFDEKAGTFSEKKIIEQEICKNISEWSDGNNNWLLIPGFSLTLINTSTLETRTFAPNIYNKSGYQGTYWAQVFVDRDNRIWMGYERGCNILQLNLQNTAIIPITTPGQIPFQEPGYLMTGIFYADTASYWIHKVGNGGLFQYDHQWQLLNYYTSLLPLTKTLFNYSSDINGFRTYGNFLYATGAFGLIEWNLQTHRTRLIDLFEKDNGMDLENIIAISPKIWWIRTAKKGIYVFDAEKKLFIKHYLPDPDCNKTCLPHFITGLYKTKSNKIFITSSKQLFEYDKINDRFILHSLKNTSLAFPAEYIKSIDEDKEGSLWIGTGKGMCVYDPEKKMVTKLFPENNIIGSVLNVLADKKDNIWCNTRSAIWCWVRKKEQWVSYSSLDGLPAEVYECALANLPDSSVIAGIGEKLVKFSPEFLEQNNASRLPVYITDVSVENTTISFAGKPTLEKKITVKPNEKIFSVDFAILNYDQPNAIKYLYKLEPSMKEFKENPTGHITFSYLSPGKYKLVVKGSDKLNNLTDNLDSLEIIIEPKWYQTLLFKLLTTLVLATAIIFFVRIRIATVRKESSLKQQITEIEMAALKAQMNPHFIFNCINSIDALIQSNDKYQATVYLNKFAKLIRNILDSSKQNLVTLSKDIETLQLYIDLEKFRNENKFTVTIDADKTLLQDNYKIPPLIIQPYVENAILHGLKKRMDNDGRLLIVITKQNGRLCFIIEDNGVGRQMTNEISQDSKRSYGMQMSSDRVKLFNNEKTASVFITDLEKDGKATGTKVEVFLNI